MMALRGANMNRGKSICVLGNIAWGFWPRRRTFIAALAAMALLPVEASYAGWLSDVFKGSSKHAKPSKQAKPSRHVTSRKPATLAKSTPKSHNTRLAALGPVYLGPAALKPA